MNQLDDEDDFFMSKIWVPMRRPTAVTRYLDVFSKNYRELDNFNCALVLGPSRSGKTRMVKRWAAAQMGLEEYPDNPQSLLRFVYCEVTPACNEKTFSADLLRAFLDPDPTYGSTHYDRIQRIPKLIQAKIKDPRDRPVHFLIIDEVHCLINADTQRLKRAIGQIMTYLLNLKMFGLVLVGEPRAVQIFEPFLKDQDSANPQLEGRSWGCLPITPHQWADKEDQKEFRAFLHEIDKKLEMSQLSDLGSMEIAMRIHNFSGGLLGRAARLIKVARAFAVADKRPCISTKQFEEAVDLLRIGSAKTKLVNPFRVESPKSGDAGK